MQTFLPSENFETSASQLDNMRLGKQRVETYQILCALTNPNYGWQNHPAVKMWRNYQGALARYGIVVCQEWINRGYKDTMLPRIEKFESSFVVPWWIGDDRLHSSHRAALLQKARSAKSANVKMINWYNQWLWQENPELNYWWPV